MFQEQNAPLSKKLPFNSFFILLLCALLTSAFPFAFGQFEVLYCYSFVIIILIHRKFDRSALYFGMFTVTYLLFQILLNCFRGLEISFFQIIRTMSYFLVSLMIYAFVVRNCYIAHVFFRYENWISGFIFILLVIDILFGERLYSASLLLDDGSGRFYVFSPMLFYLLLSLALYEGRLIALVYMALIMATLQKTLIICVFLLIPLLLLYRGKVLGYRKIVLIIILAFIPFLFFGSDLISRFQGFFVNGDNWRLNEVVVGLKVYSSSFFNIIFGNGLGVPYRELTVQIDSFELPNRLAINMTYDVHNLFVDLLIKFGFIYLLAYFLFIFNILKSLPSFFIISCIAFFIVMGFSSPAVFHSIDSLGFMFGLALLVCKNNVAKLF